MLSSLFGDAGKKLLELLGPFIHSTALDSGKV